MFKKHKPFVFVVQISNYKDILLSHSCSTLTYLLGRKHSVIPCCLFLRTLSRLLSLSLSLSLSTLFSHSVQRQSVSKQGRVRRFLWRRNKGHLQEVVCERAQNASRIIRSAVMTDNRPQLIRGRGRELRWCGGAEGKPEISRDYQSQCNEATVHLH